MVSVPSVPTAGCQIEKERAPNACASFTLVDEVIVERRGVEGANGVTPSDPITFPKAVIVASVESAAEESFISSPSAFVASVPPNRHGYSRASPSLAVTRYSVPSGPTSVAIPSG